MIKGFLCICLLVMSVFWLVFVFFESFKFCKSGVVNFIALASVIKGYSVYVNKRIGKLSSHKGI